MNHSSVRPLPSKPHNHANSFVLEYENAKCDLIALTQVTTPSHAVYITSSPQTAQLIGQKPSLFEKPLGMFRYQAINIFGTQIVSTNGAVHKRHKGVVRACFGENVMQNTWDRMISALEVMMREEGVEGQGGIIRDVKGVMIKVCWIMMG
jgi:hypothetical protein